MFQYKDIQFYNDYCKGLDDFTLLEAFSKEDNAFVGKIMPNKAIYPIEIYVHIPQTFPHNKLTFRTRSISGYPHLIPYYSHPQLGSWFCLNTAFAETAEEQLNEEFNRLREWMQRQLRPELPQHIVDGNTIDALRQFNIYEGENPDELNEITNKGDFVFLGNWGKEPQNFKAHGYLHAVKYPNNKFTIVKDEANSNYKLPYVIADHFPNNIHSFAAWVKEYNWNDELCQMLLPDFKWGKDMISSPQLKPIDIKNYFLEDDEAIIHLTYLQEKMDTTEMPDAHKNALKKELENFLEDKKKQREYWNKLIGNVDDEDYEPEPDDKYLHYSYINNLHYFAIGLFNENKIQWNLVYTNLWSREEQIFSYDLDAYIFEVKSVVDIHLSSFSPAQHIKRESYFGRGMLYESLRSKNIALVGLGAIGSSLAESLVRGGINNISLWDGDIVEAGNICRSVYDQSNIGNSKALALKEHLQKISPFVNITENGYWYDSAEYNGYTGIREYKNGEFYGNINYNSQEKFISSLKNYDLIIDCTASNELLHFLSYAAKDINVLSLCITNQSKDLLCISNHTGNLFEQRKHYLACIEQETGNFYSEGTGCYSPTFLATYCDIQALTNIYVRTINREYQTKGYMDSIIWHYDDNGIIADNLLVYQLEDSPITMTIPNNVIGTIQKLPMLKNGENGYLLGGYNAKRTAIYVTNAISRINAENQMKTIRLMSKGIVDYLGNVCISSEGINNLPPHCQENIVYMAQSKNIDTNNPLVAIIAPNGNVQFALYIGKEFVPFYKI